MGTNAALFEVLGPDGGVVSALPGQALEPKYWTDARNVGFDEGRMFRWPGLNPFVNNGPPQYETPTPRMTAVSQASIGFDDFANGVITQAQVFPWQHRFTITIPGGFTNNILMLAATFDRYGLNNGGQAGTIEIERLSTRQIFVPTNIYTSATHPTNQTLGACLWYITSLLPGDYEVRLAVYNQALLGNSIPGDTRTTMSVTLFSGVDPGSPLSPFAYVFDKVEPALSITPVGTNDKPGYTWFGAIHVLANDGINNVTTINEGVGQTQLSDVRNPSFEDVLEDGLILHTSTLNATTATSVGFDALDWTILNAAVGHTIDVSGVLLTPAPIIKSELGYNGAEPILLIHDFVLNPATRHAIIITSKHVYRYDPVAKSYYPISIAGAFLYNTGTVAEPLPGLLGDWRLLGGGGADWTTVQDFDMIKIPGVDGSRRVIADVVSAAELLIAQRINAVVGAQAYEIRRAKWGYSTADRPFAFNYLGNLYVGSLGTELLKWDGVTEAMVVQASAGATPIPPAKDAEVIAERPVYAYTKTGGNEEPQVIRWPNAGTVNDFDAVDGDQGFMAISDAREEIVTIKKLREFGVVYCKDSVHFISYVGLPFSFIRRQVSNNIGPVSRGAVAVHEDVHFFMGRDNFYMLSEAGLQRIGNNIRRKFQSELDLSKLDLIWSKVNPTRREWMVSYSSIQSPDGNPDKFIIYNYETGSWTFADSPAVGAMEFLLLYQGSNLFLKDIKIPANQYDFPYDEVSSISKATTLLCGSYVNDGGAQKVTEVREVSTLRSSVEKAGIRMKGEFGTDMVIHPNRLRVEFDPSKSKGVVDITVGAKMHENQSYRLVTKRYDLANGGRGHIDFRIGGKIFLLRFETPNDIPSNYELINYRWEGETGGNR